MSNLIVDVPQTRKAGSAKKRRTVQFSTKSDIRFYQRADEADASEMYYSNEDYRAFEKDHERAIQDVHRHNERSCSSLSTDDFKLLYGRVLTTGIENDLMKKTMAKRTRYLDAVLDEQDRQDAAGYCDPDRLAYVSRHYSKWSAKRALKIGMMQQPINMFSARAA